ncbi:MAG: uracil-DNA glycosylase [Alteromonadaceae bacterium]|nr:uracil-DNA glycosylase [Alteromonadaceae bacterium]
MSNAPNCWQCRYFKITHHKSFPYGCDVIGFKSKQLPCLQVRRIDGRECRSFAPKPDQKLE